LFEEVFHPGFYGLAYVFVHVHAAVFIQIAVFGGRPLPGEEGEEE
jgi:hypothetical protein